MWKRKKTKYMALAFILMFFLPLKVEAISARDRLRVDVSPGVIRREVEVQVNNRRHIVDLIEVDLRNPYAQLEVIAGRGKYTQKATVSEMADQSNAFALINGDFFNMNKQGAPFGPSVVEGKLQSSPLLSIGLHCFGIDSNRQAYIGSFTFQGKAYAEDGASYPLAGLNKTDYIINHTGVPSHKDSIQIYNDFWASSSRGRRGSGEVLLGSDYRVEKISLSGPISGPVPKGKYILQVNGQAKNFISRHVRLGSKLRLDYKVSPDRNWEFLIGGHAMLVDKGRPLPYTLDIDALGGRRARSGVGISQDGKKVFLASTEGRNKRSPGMQLNEWTVTMQGLGAYKALNLDGGGSTTMVARENGDFKNTVVTHPEKHANQRKIVNGIGVMNKAPEGPLAAIELSGPSHLVQGEVASYGIQKGWDANFHPKNVNGLNYAVTDTRIGREAWSGYRFLSSQPGQTTIRLQTMDGVVGTKEVSIQGPEALESIRLEAKTQGLSEGSVFPISVYGLTKDKRTIRLDPSQMNWTFEGLGAQGDFESWKPRATDGSLQDPVGLVEILDLQNFGYGEIRAQFGNHTDSVYVDSPYYRKLHMIIGDKNYSIDSDWFVMDTSPKVRNNRTLVPLRFLLEGFGAEVRWNPKERSVFVNYKGQELLFTINSNQVLINGQYVEIDVPARIEENRTLIPVRFLSEQLGMNVNYIHKHRFVDIYEKK